MSRREKPLDAARFFAALADPARLRLLNLMAGREVCVCYFVAILGEGQPKISRHLAYLRRAGLVSARREGKWVHYRIRWPEDSGGAMMLRCALEMLADRPEMRADLAKLERACCEPRKSDGLEGAPMPASIGYRLNAFPLEQKRAWWGTCHL